jgi:hypothetical protein
VFSAALVTSLAVSGLSTRSIESFLRTKIDEKFPALLHATSQRLDLYYAQRQLDVETFARSAVVTANVAGLAAARSPAAVAELRTYLGYVLERFPQYQALFLLDAQGHTLLWMGEDLMLPASLRARAARVVAPTLGDIDRVGGRRLQLVSAPVQNARDTRVATLHALLDVASVDRLLESDDDSPNLDLFVVGRDGTSVILAPGGERRPAYARAIPESGVQPVADYTDAEGVHRVGTAARFDRFGWTLVVEEPYDDAFAPVVDTVRGQLL